MSIMIEDYTFDGPFARVEELNEKAGVYAVVCLMSNQKHFLLDVGESDDIRNAIEYHDRKDCWISNCKGNILVAALYTKEMDGRGRQDIADFIRSREFAPCGVEK
ncbi:MAG: hypothetical protein JSV21_02755 [Nitrospirota bacterium]|nr:MAG: hypothetical protein JSV21_02755 [Nitrospirota bacterium]